MPFEIAAQEAIRWHLEFQRRRGGVIGRRGAVLLGQGQYTEDAAYTGRAVVIVDVGADGVEMRAGVMGAREQRERRPRCPRGAGGVLDTMPAARGPDLLAQELTRRRRQQTDVQVRPVHLDALADPAGRRGVVRGLDFHAAVEMDGAPPEAVVPKRLDGQWPEHRPFLGKHRSHLPLRGAVDARVGPVRLPAIQMGVRLLQALEAQSVQRRALRMANARFDFAFAIRIAHATWEADDPIVREHVAIDGIERRVVDVRREHAFFESVEDDEARRAAQPAKRPLVELATSARSSARRAGSPRCASSRASGRRAACVGTWPSADDGPSGRRRSRPALLHPVPS